IPVVTRLPVPIMYRVPSFLSAHKIHRDPPSFLCGTPKKRAGIPNRCRHPRHVPCFPALLRLPVPPGSHPHISGSSAPEIPRIFPYSSSPLSPSGGPYPPLLLFSKADTSFFCSKEFSCPIF